MAIEFSSKITLGTIGLLAVITVATSLPKNWDTKQGQIFLTQEINQPDGYLYEALRKIDTDKDGLPDGWEEIYFGSTGLNPYQDYDGDGLSNGEECNPKFIFDHGKTFNYCISIYDPAFTDPRNPDTNQNGITDGDEFWGRNLVSDIIENPMYPDVPEGHRYFESINIFQDSDILPRENLPANKFRPDKPISRSETLVFLVSYLNLEVPDVDDLTQLPFSDIRRIRLWSTPYLQTALDNDLIPFIPPSNTFRPNDEITRAEFLELVFTAFDLETEPMTEDDIPPFLDTSLGWWDIPYIHAAKHNGLMDGFPDGKFYPQNPVTRAEATDLIVKAEKLSNGEFLIEPSAVEFGTGETIIEDPESKTTPDPESEIIPEPEPTCPENIAPVCSSENETFDNQCLLEQAEKTLLHVGICDSDRDLRIRFTAPANLSE